MLCVRVTTEGRLLCKTGLAADCTEGDAGIGDLPAVWRRS